MLTLTDAMARRAVERADAPALLWNDQTYSYADLARWSGELAGGLIREGVHTGDRVVIGLPNSPELIVTLLAVLRMGAVLVPLNPAASSAEAQYIVSDSGATLVLTHADQAKALTASTTRVITTLEGLRGPSTEFVHRDAEDPALIVFTSGTTGRPKGAVLPQRALYSNLSTVAAAWRWTPADRLLLTLPCFHMHGLALGILGSLLVGSSIVLRPRFVTEDVPILLSQYRCSLFFGVPTMYNRLVMLPDAAWAGIGAHRMRLFVSGSAPLTPATFERFHQRFGYEILDRFGMTEACFFLAASYDGPRRPGVVGCPLPGVDVRLVDPDAADRGRLTPVADGETGEIVIRGPNLFSGYWRRPEDTRQAFVGQFFRSGDLAVREPDGMIRIVGRQSVDIIKSRGFKISAVEIENCLQTHPAIAEVAIVGVPDPDRGEAIVAVVTLAAGATLSPEALRAFARQHLAPHKVPARVEYVDEIPRTGPGKFKKRDLIERLATVD